MGSPANYDQDSFGWFQDNNSNPDACTQIGATNSNPTADLDVNYNLRFLLQNTGGKDGTNGFTLWRDVNGGGYSQVTTSSTYARIFASANWSDGAAVGNVIGGGTYDEGYTDSNGSIASFTLTAGQESECVWCIQFRSADVVGTETVTFEMRFSGGGSLDVYTTRPTVTSWNLPPTVFPYYLLPKMRHRVDWARLRQ